MSDRGETARRDLIRCQLCHGEFSLDELRQDIRREMGARFWVCRDCDAQLDALEEEQSR